MLPQGLPLLGERGRGIQNLAGSLSGFTGSLVHLCDFARDFIRSCRCLLNDRCNLPRCRALFVDCGGDFRGCLADSANDVGYPAYRRYGIIGFALNLRKLGTYFFGRFCRLRCEGFDLLGDHGKPTACIAGTGGFDRCVKRQKVGLRGDIGDQIDDLTDFVDRFGEFLGFVIGRAGFRNRDFGNFRRFIDMFSDRADG